MLNSRIFSFVHESIALNKGKTFAKVLLRNLAKLPVYNIDSADERKIHQAIVDLVKVINIVADSKQTVLQKTFKDIVDGLFFDLYYSDHMEEKNISIIKYVLQYLASHKSNFDDLQVFEKEKKIEQLYQKWTHPDNEVRNRIKLFAVRSPDILKPILESK